MSLYRDRLRPALFDLLLRRAERRLGPERRRLLANARGRVLEIGAGTGFNVPHYPAAVVELVLSDPADGMLARARRRAAASGRPVVAVRAGAEALPFPDGSFDTVVSTLVLCSVQDVERSLAEIHRVLRPDGQLLFYEHVRDADPRRARWQDRLERPWRVIADGCHPNRATLERIAAGPFTLGEVEHGELPCHAPPIIRARVAGIALAAPAERAAPVRRRAVAGGR